MMKPARLLPPIARIAAIAIVLSASTGAVELQAQTEPKAWTAQDDHKNMMEQLGITALRPGPSGNEADANHANYDESKANPFPKLPDVLTLKNGTKVTTAAQWAQRRAEIVEDFDREVFGRIPKNVPKVTWTVTATDTGTVAGRRVVGKQLIGHVDNSAYPADQRRHLDDARASGRREVCSGDDHVRWPSTRAGGWTSRAAAAAGRSRLRLSAAAAGKRRAGDRTAHRRRMGFRIRESRTAFKPTTARA